MILRWNILFALIWATDFVYGGDIIEGPANVTLAVGDRATLRCVVNKSVDEEVHWLRDNLLLFVEREIIPGVVSGADEYRFDVIGSGNEYTLQITQVTASDQEKYTCKVLSRGVGGTTSQRSSFLTVHRPPRKIDPTCSVKNVNLFKRGLSRIGRLTAHTYTAGTKISLQCNSDRGYPEIKLDWRDIAGSAVNATLDDSKGGLFTLYFSRVLTPDDNRQFFTCTSKYTSSFVRNQTGSCEIGPVIVQYPPTNISITGIKDDGMVDFGKSLFISCIASGGNPEEMTYTWTFSSNISAERYEQSSHVLNLHSVQEADQGLVIQCSATNSIGEAISTNVTLNVTNIPTTREPTTRIPTEHVSTVEATVAPAMPFTLTYIIIVILVALVILLGTVCLVLFLVNRKNKVPLQHMPMSEASSEFSRSQSYGRQYSTQFSTNTYLEDDACSLKGKGSRPGTPCTERRVMDVENKLHELESMISGNHRAQDNFYGDALGVQPEDSISNVNIRASPLPGHRQMLSPEPDDLKKHRRSPRESPESSSCSHCSHHSSRQYQTTTPNPEKTHRNLRPTNSTGPDWPKNYSPLAGRYYSQDPEHDQHASSPSPSIPNTYHTIGASPRCRRATQGDVEMLEEEYRKPVKKTHRRNRSQGSASGIMESPVSPVISPTFTQHQHSASPVMQRKNRRKASGGSLNQLQILKQQGPSSHRTSPRPSPRSSPNSSPVHRPHANRPLPDPGLDNEDLLIEFDAYASDPNQPSYSNRTPVSARKQYTRPQHGRHEYYVDSDEYEDNNYSGYDEESESDDSDGIHEL